MAMEPGRKQLRADARHQLPGDQHSAVAGPRKPQDRVLRFLGMIRLLAGGQEWGTRQLSQEFEVTERTVLRDMKLLEEAGLVVRPGSRGRSGYRLARQAAWQSPQLSMDELLALIMLMGQAADSHAANDTAAALLKLITLQSDDVRHHLDALVRHLTARKSAPRAWLCRQNWLPLLMRAIVHHRPLRVWLQEEEEGAGDQPLVLVPTTIEFREGSWLLWGYEVSGSDIIVELQSVDSMRLDVETV